MNSTKQLLVVGSVAIDWVITPYAEREVSVGGSATYFSMAASYHSAVRLVGVVGRDFPDEAISDLKHAGVDIAGLEVVGDGQTFRWKGRYHENMNQRDTLETHLNCFEAFSPKLPTDYRNSDLLFLANIQPELQLQVLDQMSHRPAFVGLDTMQLWIDIASEDLRKVISRVDMLAINEEEALQFSGEVRLSTAANKILQLGPKYLIIKRGEYGAVMFAKDGSRFALPALILDDVVDPTGAGDCFAGGLMGYLAGVETIDGSALRKAVVWGSVMASYCVEGFSYDRIKRLPQEQINARYDEFVKMVNF